MSGVVFTVDAERPHREHKGRTLYFCCEGCAGYFDTHAEQVAALRGL